MNGAFSIGSKPLDHDRAHGTQTLEWLDPDRDRRAARRLPSRLAPRTRAAQRRRSPPPAHRPARGPGRDFAAARRLTWFAPAPNPAPGTPV